MCILGKMVLEYRREVKKSEVFWCLKQLKWCDFVLTVNKNLSEISKTVSGCL